MNLAERISVEQARSHVEAGDALLVCAYDDEERFRTIHLEGGISREELRQREPALSKEQEIIFYCA